MKNEKGEITLKSIWKWLRSDTGRKFSFLLFYVFFFTFLFLFFSFSGTTSMNHQQESELSFPYSIKNIEASSYTFSYLLKINETTKEFLGEKKNGIVTMQDDTGIYEYFYQEGSLVFEGEQDPLAYSEFLDIYELKRMLKNSKLVSETKVTDTNEYIYNYSIQNEILSKLLDLPLEANEKEVNEIIVKTDSKKELKSITLNLVPFFKEVIEDPITTYEITFTYGDTYE